MFKTVFCQAATNESPRRTFYRYVEDLSDVRTPQEIVFSILLIRRPRRPLLAPPASSVLPSRYARACG